MTNTIKSIRPFIGAAHFEISRRLYHDLGFTETVINPKMSLFTMESVAFYLQDAYVKDGVDNTMVFVEVVDVQKFWISLWSLDLESKYENVRLIPIRKQSWGSECFVHDPSGILWHFGTFNL